MFEVIKLAIIVCVRLQIQIQDHPVHVNTAELACITSFKLSDRTRQVSITLVIYIT